MSVFQVIAVLLTLTALFSYLNYRFIRLPTTIGVMLIALIASLALIALQHFGFSIGPMAGRVLQSVRLRSNIASGNVELSALRWRASHQPQRSR